MVQGRVVRPLVMASQPSSKQPTQKHQSQKKSRQHQSDRRRSSQDDIHTLDKDFDNIVDSYDHLDRRSRRYDRLSSKKPTTISRMKTIFENSLPNFKSSSNKFHETSLDDDDEDNMESQHRRHNKQHRRKREHRLSPQEHKWPFQIPPFATLSQRADLWIITALSSCVSLASFAQLISSSTDTLSTTNRRFAFSTTVISFTIAFVLGAAFRHAPFRHAFTRSLSIISPPSQRLDAYQSPITMGIKQAISQSYISLELLLVSILSIFWTFAIPIIVDGFNSIGQDPLAVFGMEIWNANLYYSSWISVLLVGYIFIELITSTDRYGTVTTTASSASSWKENTFSKRWVLLTFTSAIVLSASVSVYSSSLCDGEILKGTVYCRKALFGILVGGFLQLFLCCCVGIVYRLRSMDYTSSSAAYYYDSKGKRRKANKRHMRKKMSVWKREQYSLYFGILSLLVQSINVALLTNPVESGPGNSSGSLYFASWISFFLVVEMCLRYLELHTTSAGRKVKRKSEKAPNDDTDHSDVTYDSDEDELPPERQSSVVRILRNESLGSRSSSGAPVYEEVDSFSAESPRYGLQQVEFRMQPLLPPAPSPPDDANQRLLAVSDGPMRSTLEPEEEEKVSPNSGSFAESVRDFSIGSRKISPDPSPSGDLQQRALPPYRGEDSASDDISNDELFQDQVSRSQSFVTQNSKEEVLDEPRGHSEKYGLRGSRHNNSSSLSPLNESSREGRRSSDSINRSRSGSERSGSRSGDERSGSRKSKNSRSQQSGSFHSGSRGSRSRNSGSYMSGSHYSSEESQEQEQIPPPPVYRPSKPVRQKSKSSRSKSKSRSRSGSRGKSKSGSRRSHLSGSRGNPEIGTDSEPSSDEDSPPPTVSDSGKSQRSNLSGFSQGSPATQSRSKSTRSENNDNGPPPPPFQRSEVEVPKYFKVPKNQKPMTNVFTKQGPGDESVVSDPTLDASFHNIPNPVPARNSNGARIPRNKSDPSFDHDKSVTSSPGSRSSEKYRRSSSDELPSSEENLQNSGKGSGDEKVDNIVAAALAYAEKTHSLTSHGNSSPPPQSRSPKKRHSGTMKEVRRRKSDPELRASHTSGTSSAIGSNALSGASLHSFYSGDKSQGEKERKLERENSKRSMEGSYESHPTQPSVQDMVSAALAYAEETRGRGRNQKQQEKSAASSRHSKSIGSMFSESDASSGGDRSEFDC